ncbi:MAG: FlgD immunoglobulin-like domain containing protein [Candidatus Zipacnadales bacterium]
MVIRYGHLPNVVLLSAILALLAAATLGQSATVSVDHPAGISRLFIEIPGTTGNNDPASRFQLWSLSGDPTTSNDDNRPIASVIAPFSGDVSAFSSITTISIDNTNTAATDQVLEDLSNIQDGGGREFWPLMPTARTRDIIYRMLVGIDDDPDVAVEIIEVSHEATLLRDTVKLDYILTNRGTVAHSVGLRIFIDCTFGVSNQDGTYITLSDGTVVDTEAVFPGAKGGSIPDAWISVDNVSSPSTILRGTITGGEVNDPGQATYSAGPPDAVEFGQRVNMGRDNQFVFIPNASASLLGEDWGYAVRWDEELLPVGASRRYVTYFGLGGAASDFSPPYVLAAYAPFQLQVIEGDDPLTPTVIEDAYLADSSGSSVWEVRAFCDNFGAGNILDARATLSLPEGFELDQSQGTQSRTILLGTIPRNVQVEARWRVRVTESVRPGLHELRVTGPLGRAVRRTISVPALPTLPQSHLDPQRGLSMVTVPYLFQNTDANHVFQSLGGLEGSSTAALARWHPITLNYRFYPDDYVANIEPGAGYWLLNRLRTPIVFPAPPDRRPVPINQSYPISLSEGWNQIGCPFLSAVRLDQVTVVGPDGIDRSISEAYNAGLIVPTLYSYDTATNEYTFNTMLSQMILEPYVGYWIRALRPVTMMFPPPGLMPFKTQTPLPAVENREGWRVPLVLSTDKLVLKGRAFGASPASKDGLDLADVMCPPAPAAPVGGKLGLYFVRSDEGGRVERFYTDIRSARPGKQNWTFVVETDMANTPITISWPDLSAMPKELVATLEDLQTGHTCFMRTTTAYTFDSGQATTRQFRLTVEPRLQVALQITGFHAEPVGQGVRISCTLSTAAGVEVIVRNLAGRVVKRLLKNHDMPAGELSVLWTGQAENGLQVPNGAYIVEIVANTVAGERTGILRPIHYRR